MSDKKMSSAIQTFANLTGIAAGLLFILITLNVIIL